MTNYVSNELGVAQKIAEVVSAWYIKARNENQVVTEKVCETFHPISFGNDDDGEMVDIHGVKVISPFDEPLLVIGYYGNSYPVYCEPLENLIDADGRVQDLVDQIRSYISSSDLLGGSESLMVELP